MGRGEMLPGRKGSLQGETGPLHEKSPLLLLDNAKSEEKEDHGRGGFFP